MADDYHDIDVLKQAQRSEEAILRLRAQRAAKEGRPFDAKAEAKALHRELLQETQRVIEFEEQKGNPLDRNNDNKEKDKYWRYDRDDMSGTDQARLDTAKDLLRREVITDHLIENRKQVDQGKKSQILSPEQVDKRVEAELEKTPLPKELKHKPATPFIEMLNDRDEEKDAKPKEGVGGLASLPEVQEARDAMQAALERAAMHEERKQLIVKKAASREL